MNSLNSFLLNQITSYLPSKDKLNLKLTNKKFNKVVDLSQDYHEWKVKKAKLASNCDHVIVDNNNLFYRIIVIKPLLPNSDYCVTRTITCNIQDVDWKNLKKKSLSPFHFVRDNNMKLYKSLILINDVYYTGNDEVTLTRTSYHVTDGSLEQGFYKIQIPIN